MNDCKHIFKRCGKTAILINTDKLEVKTAYNLNIILNLNKKIIKGTVYDKKGEPSIGAAIEILQINEKTNVRKVVGYSYTNDEGKYLFCVEVLPHMFYEIDIYSPLNI